MYQPTNAKQITSAVAERLDMLKDEGLALPANYNAQNALKAAYLRLQTVKDRQGNPALTVCTEPSIANALLDMAIQGLSPAKNQCYFIVYGNELQMQRSYFGTIAALKRLDSIEDIDAQVVHRGDKFEIGADEIGHIIVTKFEPSFANLDKELIGAFAFIKLANGRVDYTVMTKAQIDTSWAQSRNRQNNVQKKFSDEMAKRTVLNRAAKMFINTSDDSDLLTGSINSTTEAEYEEPKDVTATTEEENSAQLLADFNKAQASEKKDDTPQGPEEAVEAEKVEDGKTIESDVKKDFRPDPQDTGKGNEEELPDGQTSIYDFVEGDENA
ncbi:recombinase RecT [Limosilactobacillus fermentum]|uniref:recombinase RecT n=4 Tax=Bacteria TaxID=2 RepID=UPI0016584091|nr:RecT family recombinase [Limosilactobacillus fermentum]MBC9021227.1 recombinase RecT [Limosilactobacillus fermentum CECT 5716]MCB4715045.1 recombinase RecT [Limosilactobacillus fermentum]MCH5396663.1 recombinase RecT [Limosilactobacillus fermentum]WCL66001.1 recombinase RecT [Limosilactobacillus fermentum]